MTAQSSGSGAAARGAADIAQLPMAPPRRLHIGHHFFGTGNIGDDLMLAGFLAACSGAPAVSLTCATAGDITSQRRRFPQVQWLPYEMDARIRAVEACDAWVGVGDTPFQLSVGPWFLEHLAGEVRICREHRKPMFFIGVGVSEPQSLDDARGQEVLRYASHLWARDAWSAEQFARAGAGSRTTLAADLANIYLGARRFGPREAGVTGYVLNFEDPRQFRPHALDALVRGRPGTSHRWLFQEVRPLHGSEGELYEKLAIDVRRALDVRRPDYPGATVDGLLSAWGVPEQVISSRYHGALAASWMGARVVAVERSTKLSALVSETGIAGLPAFHDAAAIGQAIDRAASVGESLLRTLGARARSGCAQLLAAV